MDKTEKLIEKLGVKESFTFEDLCDLIYVLRSDKGCPWDRKQTNKSIRNAMIDETYEFIEGLDNDDDKLMCEELGDVLLQIVFHANVKAETNTFDINDVIDGICKKMILRHPHVFGNVKVSDSGEVLDNWEKIKNVEKQRKTPMEQLESVSKALPSLMRAQKLQAKAEKSGLAEKKTLDFYSDEIMDNAQKLKSGICSEEILAKLLFNTVGAARCKELEAEELLYRKNDAFIESFKH